MESSTIVLICLAFCTALVLSSIINRPKVIIQSGSQENTNLGCIFSLIGLLVISVFIIFLLWPKGNQESKSVEIPQGENKKQNREKPETDSTLRQQAYALNINSRWILLLKEFDSKTSARIFRSKFPTVDIRTAETEQGVFWAYVLVHSQNEGNQMRQEWEINYPDYSSDLEVLEANIEF